jgi:hypothetical protein
MHRNFDNRPQSPQPPRFRVVPTLREGGKGELRNGKYITLPLGDCVTIVMKGGFRWNRQSGSSALECGRLRVWVIGLLRNGILFMGLEPRSGEMKGFHPAYRQAGLRFVT